MRVIDAVGFVTLIYSMMANKEAAQHLAVAGTERGAVLEAPFVTAVGADATRARRSALQKMRQVISRRCKLFEQGLVIADELDVPRLKVEAYWGCVRWYGFRGRLDMAPRFGRIGHCGLLNSR